MVIRKLDGNLFFDRFDDNSMGGTPMEPDTKHWSEYEKKRFNNIALDLSKSSALVLQQNDQQQIAASHASSQAGEIERLKAELATKEAVERKAKQPKVIDLDAKRQFRW